MPAQNSQSGRLVLASASPRRRALLRWLGLEPQVRPAALDETIDPTERPAAAALRLARAKAALVAAERPTDWVLAADTVVIGPSGEALGKPADAAEAERTLRELRGRRHQVVTAQALAHGGLVRTDRLGTLVIFRALGDAEIAAYIATGDPFDKAGSYAIQHPILRPVQALNGCYLNVVGLPLCRTSQLLREAGFPGSLPDLRPPWCDLCRRAAAGADLTS